jgi:multiple sugar transport system permease protein
VTATVDQHSSADRGIPAPQRQRGRPDDRPSPVAISILCLGAFYALLPVVWVVMASTKNTGELFNTFTLMPSTHLIENVRELSSFNGGIYWKWTANTALYSVVGGAGATLISAITGYVFAKFDFPGKSAMFGAILAGVLVPGIIIAIPQYFLFSAVHLADTYWSVLLPQMITPYGIYLARIYAAAAVPTDLVEAARTDRAGEFYIFWRIALPLMSPGLVTIFLFQFVAIWNNFMLPYIMLSSDRLFPLTVGLQALLNQGSSSPAAYTVVIPGALLSIAPLIAIFIVLQRYWRIDLASGAVKS